MAEDKIMSNVLTVAEVADRLRVSELTVYRLVHAGEIPAFKVRSLWRVDAGDLDNYIQMQKAKHAQNSATDHE